MITFNVTEGEGKLIVHMTGDNSNYEVSYDHGNLIFTKGDRQYIIPETNADDLYFDKVNPNTSVRKYNFVDFRNIYRDTTPTDFGISDLVDVMPGSSHFTDEITLGGVNDKVPVIAPAGAVIYVNGVVTPSGTLVDNGDVIKFEITATSETDTTENIVMSIGDISKSFNITTNIPFTNFTFTNAGATGYAGPTLGQMTSAYSGQVWFDQYFSSTIQGVQTLTIPHTGTYRITAAGAQGAYKTSNGAQGGYGAILRVDVSLTEGTALNLVVGQAGSDTTITTGEGTGGGGGSFVYTGAIGGSGLILAAGGGGGTDDGVTDGKSARSDLNPTNDSGSVMTNNGQDGLYNSGHAAYGCGAGWLNDQYSRVGDTTYYTAGRSISSPYFEGGRGDVVSNYSNQTYGGFGGGGANYDDGGAGGGFTGGSTTSTASGGAGGSYYAGMNNTYYTSSFAGVTSNYVWLGNNGAANTQRHGYITIEFLG